MSGYSPDLLAGRRAIVTGAATGIGAAIARSLSACGARVAIIDTDLEGARSVSEALAGIAVGADVSDSQQVGAAFAQVHESFGGLEIVVNNAGVGSVTSLHRYSDDDWTRLIDVNLKGVFNGIRAAVPLMTGGGAIVNISSLSGTRPTHGEGPYSAAKAGVIALTSSAALEYGPSIRVNCVSPGMIETQLTAVLLKDPDIRARLERRIPSKRIGTADEVAAAVTFLASELASYITGVNLVVDGGSILPSVQTDDMLARFVEFADRRLGG